MGRGMLYSATAHQKSNGGVLCQACAEKKAARHNGVAIAVDGPPWQPWWCDHICCTTRSLLYCEHNGQPRPWETVRLRVVD